MEWDKIKDAAFIPTIAIVVFGIIGTLSSIFIGDIISNILNLALFAIQCLVLGYAGYVAIREYQLDVTGAALTGALTEFISLIINSIIAFALTSIYPVSQVAPKPAVGWALIVIVFLFEVGFAVVVGAVLGAVGGYIAQKTKSKQS